jgi:hypothetical protein
MLEVDAVAGGCPRRHLADAAQAYCEGEVVLFDLRDARHREQRGFAVERSDWPPGLGRRIAEDRSAGRDLVAG